MNVKRRWATVDNNAAVDCGLIVRKGGPPAQADSHADARGAAMPNGRRRGATPRSGRHFLAQQPRERRIGVAEDRDLVEALRGPVPMGQPQLIGARHDDSRKPTATLEARNQDFVDDPLKLICGQLRNCLPNVGQRTADRETDRVLEHLRPVRSYVGRVNVTAPRLENDALRGIVGIRDWHAR